MMFLQHQYIYTLFIALSFALLAACAQPDSSEGELTQAESEVIRDPQEGGGFFDGYQPEKLSWESASKPERTVWSNAVYNLVHENFTIFDQAKDIDLFCPQYNSLSREQRINAWGAVISGTTYYESGYNPASASVDVGNATNKDTWSVGLLQMSVVDQKNYGFKFGYSFEDLKTPIKNLHLGISILARQIAKYGIILIPVGAKGLYWAVLHPGGKYDASAKIMKMVQKLSFCR